MRDRGAHVLGDVRGHDQGALLMAAGAQAPTPAGEGDEELVVARAAANPREAVTQIAALKERRRGFGDDGPPESVPILGALRVNALELVEAAFDQPGERRLARPPGAVDTILSRGRARHVDPLAWGPRPGLATTRRPAWAASPMLKGGSAARRPATR